MGQCVGCVGRSSKSIAQEQDSGLSVTASPNSEIAEFAICPRSGDSRVVDVSSHGFVQLCEKPSDFVRRTLDFQTNPAIVEILDIPGNAVALGDRVGSVAKSHSLNSSGKVDETPLVNFGLRRIAILCFRHGEPIVNCSIDLQPV